ncbi:MAG TPA: alpha/beta hydrolase [Solirubrobacteraceae bacterium]|nr:alpha/beta hydrolase [Solirubrobacteraceae bacterium]
MGAGTVARRALRSAVLAAVVASVGVAAVPAASASAKTSSAPTVVLVHAAWAHPPSWSSVASQLRRHGHPVVVADNPLRTLAGDAAFIAGVLKGIEGPIVLVGHSSYGGSVITNAAAGNPDVEALVYVAAFAPERGETTFALGTRFPGSLLPASLVPLPFMRAGGAIGVDLYVNPLLYAAVLAHDVAAREAAAMAAAQRPVTLAALTEPSQAPAWRRIPSWYLVARGDRALPPAAQRFMAARAGAHAVEVSSSHSVPVARPKAVAQLILAAARPAAAPPPAAPRGAWLRVSPPTFRAARSGPSVKAAAARTGGRVSYTLDAAAVVRFTLQRLTPGRRLGGRCVRAAPRGRTRTRCSSPVQLRSSFTRRRPAGRDRFTFTGRLAGRSLKPGRYRLVATPIAGGRVGMPARAGLRIAP